MKKLLLLIMCIAVALGMSVSALTASDDWQPDKTFEEIIQRDDDVIARLFICSDTHIGIDVAEGKLEYAYSVADQMGQTDAFIIAGDLTDTASEKEYKKLMDIVSANSKELPVAAGGYVATGTGDAAKVNTTLMVRGNHDISKYFDSVTGMSHDGLYWINGVPVIAISMESGKYDGAFASKHDFIKQSLEEITNSGWTGHIFLISHMAPLNTTIGSEGSLHGECFTPETMALLAEYPQIINVAGHTHDAPYSAKFIDQSAGFTSINDGVLGKDYNNDYSDHSSSAILFDVMSDGTTVFHRLNMAKGEIMFDEEEWVLDSSDTAKDFIYFADPAKATNTDAYHTKSTGGSFPVGSEATVEDVGNFDSIKVTFPKASPASIYNHDYIYRYTVEATPVNGGTTVITNHVKNDAFLPEAMRADSFTVRLTGLDYDTDYKVEVFAETSYGVKGAPLTVAEYANIGSREFTYPVKTLYSMDYSYGETADAMGHDATLSPVSKPAYDETIGQQALTIKKFIPQQYEFGSEEFDAMKMEFTIEAYFYLTDVNTRQEIIGMASSASTALGVMNGKLYYFMEAPECTENMFFRYPVNEGEWIHTVITYDSRNLSFYVNGEFIETARQPGGLARDEDSDFSQLICVGGRFSSGSEAYLMLDGSKINLVKIYQGAMTSEDVSEAYQKATKPNAEIPFTDVKKGGWYESGVVYVYENGLMNGSSKTTFSPAVKTSRAMIVQMLYNMEGAPEVEYKNVFSDVKEKAWYADAVIWAYENGVTSGSSATTFSPDTLVTREQVAVFLYRYLRDFKGQKMDEGADLSAYPDAEKVSRYTDFKEAVAWANAVGVIGGKSNGNTVTLSPLDNAQRSEAATMLARFHRKFMN